MLRQGGLELDDLEERVEKLRVEHDNRWIAPVSRGLDALLAGRVACLRLRQALRAKDEPAVAKAKLMATERLAFAVAVFRANHHVWTLPEALRARAQLRRRVGDDVGADADGQEAETIVSAMVSPAD